MPTNSDVFLPNNSDAFVWIGTSGSSWQVASDWQDVTSGQNPASAVPGAGNAVTIVGATGTVYEVISGGGAAATTTLTGLLDLVGSYTLGTLGVGTVLASGSGGTATVGNVIVGAGSSVQAGAVNVADGTLALSGTGATLSASGAVSVGTPGGDLTSSSYLYSATGSLSVAGGGTLTAAANVTVAGSGSLSAQDAGTSVAIGGNLTLGTAPPSSTTPPYTYASPGTLSVSGGASVAVTGNVTEADAGDQITVSGAGSTLTAGGSLTLNGIPSYSYNSYSLSVSSSGVVRVGGLSVLNNATSSYNYYTPSISVDSTSSVEVGTAGGAAAGTLTIDAGNTVSVISGGLTVSGTVSGGGTLSIGAGGTLTVNGLAGTAQVLLAANTTMTLNGTAAAGDGITFAGAGNNLVIGATNAYNYQTSVTTYTPYAVQATVTGFATGDAITLSNVSLTNAVYTSTGANTGTLALYAGTTAVETLTLAGNYTGRKFLLSPTTGSGSSVVLLPSSAGGNSPVSTNSDAFVWIGTSGSSWQVASDWQDVTSGQNPASAVPGAGNAVTIVGATGTVYEVISGGGAAATTTLTGLLDLVGSYTLGTLGVGTVLASGSGGTATVGNVIVGAGSSVQAGAVNVADGTLALSGTGATLSASGAVSVGTPGGDLTSSSYLYSATGSLSVAGGGTLTAAANVTVAGSGSLSAQDAGTSVAIGGNLTLGTAPPSSTTPPYTYASPGTLSVSGGASVAVTGNVTEADAGDQITVSGAGSTLTAGGSLTLNGIPSYSYNSYSLSVSSSGVVRVGGLSVLNNATSSYNYYTPSISVDSTSSVEVGTAGGAAAGTLTIDAGNTVSVISGGLTVSGTVSGGGTLSIGAGGTLTVNGLAGTAQVLLAANTTMTLNGTAAAGDGITFAGAGNNLVIGATNAYNYQTSVTTYTPYAVQATVTGFATGDAITLSNVSLTNAVYTSTGANTGTLALYAGTTAVETLTLAGNYTGRKFLLSPTTGSGSSVVLLPSSAGGNSPVSTNSDAFVWIGTSGSSWQVASDWQDVTSGQNPASAVPGAGNAVTIVGATGTVYEVISGGGAAATTTLTGLLDLVGSYTLGTLGVGTVLASGSGGTATVGNVIVGAGSSVQAGAVNVADGTLALSGTGATLSASGAVSVGTPGGDLTSSSYLYSATGSLSVAGGGTLTAAANVTVAGSGSLSAQDAGTSVAIGGNLTLGTAPPSSTTPPYTYASPGTLSVSGGASVAVTGNVTEADAGDQITVSGAGSTLTAGGSLTLNGIPSYSYNSYSLSVSSSGVVRVGGLSVLNNATSSYNYYTPSISVDSTSSVEVGTAGGAAAGTLTIDAGNTVSVISGGLTVSGTVSGGGTLSIGAGGTLTVNGLAGTAQVLLAANTTMTLNGTAAAGDGITFAGAGNNLVIGATNAYNYQTSVTTYTPYAVQATVTGFATGDAITLSNVSLTNAVYTSTGANTGTLALYAGTTAVETLTLAGNYTGRKFLLSPTTGSGSAVSLLAQPGYAIPSSEAVLAGVITSFSGFAVSDTNAQATGITVTLSDSAGLLGVAASGGATLTGSNTSRLTISGTIAQVNAALAGLNYVSASPGTDTITVSPVDSLGSSSTQAQVAVTVLPVAPPTITVPSGGTPVRQGTALSLNGVTIVYPDGVVPGEQVSVTVSDSAGILSIDSTTPGGGGVVSGNQTNSLSLVGTIAQVDADLTTLSYTSSKAGSEIISVSASGTHSGSGIGGSLTVYTVAPPAITAPSVMGLLQGKSTSIAVSLAELGNYPGEIFSVTATDTTGLLSVGGYYATVVGAGSKSVSISGSLSSVNATLASLTDSDPSVGQDTITLQATDSLGNAASPAQIAVTVSLPPVPMLASPAVVQLGQGVSTAVTGVSLSEAGSTPSETFTVTLGDASGLLSATGTGITGSGTTSLKITGSLAQVNADLATLKDTGGTTASDAITLNATDSLGGSASAASIAVAVNGPPVLAAPATATLRQTAATAISGVSLSETGDTSSEVFTVTLGDANGLLSATGTGITGSGTTSLKITGSLAQVNAGLATLQETDSATPSDTITLNATDSLGGSATRTVGETIYQEAQPSVSVPSTLIFHLGDSGTTSLAISNAAGDVESLATAITGSPVGVSAAAGPLAEIAAGGTASVPLTISTATAGAVAGKVTLSYQSDGAGTDGAPITAIGTATVNVAATVDNYAALGLAATAGSLTFDGTKYVLNLGSVVQYSATPLTVTLAIDNGASGPADLLSGNLTLLSDNGFSNSGAGTFDNLAAGASADVETGSLSTATDGTFSESFLLHSAGTNASGYDGALQDETITITGTVLHAQLPELIVSNIVAPVSALAGHIVPISWTVTNEGDGTATGPWSDQLFLASDPAGDNPQSIGTFAFTGTLAPGQSITRSANVSIPAAVSGQEWLVVRTDANDQIIERVPDKTKQTVAGTATTITPPPSPNVVVTSITPPTSAFSGGQTQISWIVTNNGDGPTSSSYWVDNVYLSLDRTLDTSDILLASVPNPSYLAPGESYESSATVTLPRGIAGPYYLIVYADVSTQSGQHGGTQVIASQVLASSPFPIVLSPAPDLQVTGIITPSQEFSGQQATLTWTINNAGTGPTDASQWSDEVLLSQDGILDSSAIVLAVVNHAGGLAPSQSYTSSATVNLPIGQSGNYTFFVVADSKDQVYELGNASAHSASKAVQINLTPPPDLEASVGLLPSGVITGHSLTISYTVTNAGSSATPNTNWTDSIYLSPEPALGSDAVLLGTLAHGGALDVGQSYTASQLFTLPDGLSGQYYVVVQADSGNNVFELDKSNNTVDSATPITIDFSPIDLVVSRVNAPSIGSAGHQILVSWQVTNDGSGSTANKHWSDEVVLSPSGILGASDNLILASVEDPGQLSGNGSYSDSVAVSLPTNLRGSYELFVVTDAGNTVPESNTTNNASVGQSLTVIPLAQLQVSGVSGPTADTAGDSVNVGWTVTNTGASPTETGAWQDGVYLSQTPDLSHGYTLLGQVQHSGILGAGGSYSANHTFTLPSNLLTGQYYFVVQAASQNQVLQVNSDGDVGGSIADAVTQLPSTTGGTVAPPVLGAPIVVIPSSDLAVSNVMAPSEVLSGQPITISWTLTNTGSNPASGRWYDEVYLSQDQVLDPGTAIPLGSFAHFAPLASGANQSFTSSFSIPAGVSGPFYVFVSADPGDALNDVDRSNNVAISSILQVDLAPPIDLTVGSVTLEPSASDAVTVTYTVSNLTPTPTSGSWEDAVYLSSTGVWNVSDPLLGYVQHTGGIAASGSYSASLTAALPGLVTGNYYAIVKTNVLNNQLESSQANNTNVSSNTISAALPTLILGTLASGTLTADAVAYYQFTVDAGETVNLSLTSDTPGTANDIYALYDAIPTLGQFDATSTEPVTQDPNAVIQESQPGTYYVMVRESAGSRENYTLTANTVGYSITGITPDQGSNLGSVTLTINGAKLNANEQVEIIAPDGTVREATKIDWVNSGQLWATFNLQGLAVGAYDVEIKDGARSATLTNGFSVTDGAAGHLSASLIAPSALHTHNSPDGLTGTETGIVTIQYTNNGGTDIAAPIFDLQATNAEFNSGVPGLISPSEVTVVGTNQTGPAGILQPGGQETISYSFAGNFGYAQFINMTLSLGVLEGTNTTIDWASLEQSVQPASIDATDWHLIWTRFEAQVGTTTESLLNALSQAATTLSQIGDSTNDLGTLLSYELAQASGALPNTTLAQTTDLDDSGTGIDLSLTRTYSASLLDRDDDGAFGDGWTFTYGIKAITDASGDVYVNSPAGTEVFKLQSDGSYTAQAADSSTLTLSSGSYVLTDLAGTIERFRPDGQIASITDADGNLVTVGYGSNGVISSVTTSSGQSLTFTTSATGQITRATDGEGRTVIYSYDSTGQHLLSVTGPGGTTSYSYDASANPLTDNALTGIVNPDTTMQSFEYDSQGGLSSQSGSGGSGSVNYSYDGPGTVVETDAQGNATTLIYDANGNLAQVHDAAGNATRLSYDSTGDLTGVIGPDGSTYSFSYDAHGNLTSYTDPLGGSVEATYKPGTDLLASFTDQDGNTTGYSYDSAGDLTGITYDNGSGTTYQYAADGALTETTDARGQTTDYTYDSSGELTKEAFSDGTSQSYAYDSNGDLISATATDGGVTSYAYNAAGELTSVTDPEGRVESYGYNSSGQEIQRVEPDGSITNYTYTASGQLAGLTDGSGNLLVHYTYNAAGQLTGANMGNGATTGYSYDALGDVTEIQTKAADGTVTSQLDYTYDSESRPVTATSLDGTWTYSYDAEGELTHAVFASSNTSIANQDLTYVYDAAGNRTQTIFNGATTNYTTNGLNQYTSANGTTYDYDADGNLVSMTSGGQTTTYSYNSQNELTSETGPSGTTTYQYDALGNQVASTVNGVQSHYVIDPLAISTSATGPLSSIAQVYDAQGRVTATYDYGLGIASVSQANSIYYYNSDATGNVVSLSGVNGELATKYDYAPFGTVIQSTGVTNNPFQFAGSLGITTDATGLLFMRARSYMSNTGKFLEQDPIGISGGTNLYVYGGNNPLTNVDPTGLLPNPFSVLQQIISGGWLGPNFQNANRLDSNRPPEVVEPGSDAETARNASHYAYAYAFANLPPAPLRPFGAFIGLFLEYGYDLFKLPPSIWYLAGHPLVNNGYNDSPLTLGLLKSQILGLIDGILGNYNNPADLASVAGVQSVDPNDIVGPAGYGPQAFIAASATDAYTIDFTNATTATAPAQQIVVTEQLDPNLDWRTFRLTGFSFDNLTTTLSRNQAFYSGLLDYSATKGYDVQVTAGVNVVTGVVTWTLQTIDPTTGQAPQNPELGLLPVDDAQGDGEGFVSYTIQAKSTVKTGDTISAQATVIFDTNAPLTTPAIVNTIDAVAPTSEVVALPSQTTDTSFEVSWSGTDDATGSGIASYTIMVSDNGAAPTAWLANTTRTNAIYMGQIGHTYAFSSIATDNAGNQEAVHVTPDATVTVEGLAIAVTERLAHDTGASASDGVTSDPKLTGTGEADAMVTFTEGTTPVGTTTADSSGAWSFTPVLADGQHMITVSESDSGGRSGLATISFVLDTQAPDMPVITGISPDTGPSSSDGVTDTGALVVTGTAEASSTIVLLDGTAQIATTTASAAGGWTITLATPLAQGTHELSATATDLAGNTSIPSATFAVKVQLPPSLALATLPETVAAGAALGNLWSQLVGNGKDLDQSSLAVTAISTVGLEGTVNFDPAHHSLTYQATGFDPAHPVDSFTYTLTDDQGMSVTGTVAVTVTEVSQPPSIVTTPNLALGVGKPHAVGVSLSESGATSGERFTVSLVDTHGLLSATGTGVSGSGTTSLTVSGSLSQVNADLGTLSDTNGTAGADSIAINASDSLGGSASPATVSVTVNGLPVLAAPTTATVAQSVATAVSGVNLSESGTTSGETFTLSLVDTSGLLSATGTGVSGSGTTSLMVSGSLSQVNADLATLSDTDGTAGSDSIAIDATDSLGNTAAKQQIAITVQNTTATSPGQSGGPTTGDGSQPASPPVITAPGSATVTTRAATAIAGVTLAETGSVAGESFTVTLSDTNGLLSATGAGVQASGSTALTIDGSLSEVNADLATLQDTDASTASDTITLNATDSLGNSAAPAQIAITVQTIGGTSPTQPGQPAITAPASATVTAGTATAISGVGIDQSGSIAGELFMVTLIDTNGLLSATGTGVQASGTTALTIAGSLAQVNADLATLQDTDASAAPDTITLNATDSLGSGAAQAQIAITVQTSTATSPTQPGQPAITAPASATVAAGAATAISGVSIGESGSVTGELFTVTLTDTNGLLSATGTGIQASGSTALTITGSLAQVNADLATLQDMDMSAAADAIALNATDSLGNSAAQQQIAITVQNTTATSPSQPGGTTTGTGSQPGNSTPASSTPVYRFFDNVYGTHLFTQSLSEAQSILVNRPDLTEETNNFGAVNPQTDPNAEAVYRFFETSNGTHFFTASPQEYLGLTTPGSATYRPDLTFEASSTFYEDSTQQAGDVAVYRLFDSVHGTQFLTGSQSEYAGLTTAGSSTYRPDLAPEGIAFYAPAGSFSA